MSYRSRPGSTRKTEVKLLTGILNRYQIGHKNPSLKSLKCIAEMSICLTIAAVTMDIVHIVWQFGATGHLN